MTTDELPEGSLLQSGLRQIEKIVEPTSATKVEVTLRATSDGQVVGAMSWTKGKGWEARIEGGYDLKEKAGAIEAKLVWAR